MEIIVIALLFIAFIAFVVVCGIVFAICCALEDARPPIKSNLKK